MNLIETVKLVTWKLYQNQQTDLATLLEAALASEHVLLGNDSSRRLAVLLKTEQWDEMLRAAPNLVLAENKRHLPLMAIQDIRRYPKGVRESIIWNKVMAHSLDLVFPRDADELRQRIESVRRQVEDFDD